MHRKHMRRALALLLGMALALSMLLPVFAAVNVPQPTDDFYFLDEPDVFSTKLETTILEENARLEKDYGVQLVMVAVQSIGDADIKDFTLELMNQWNIGGDQGKGLVLVLDIDGDNYFTIAGEGLRSFLTSDALQRLLDRNLEESFSMKNYDAGVSNYFAAVTQRIEEEFGLPEESTSEGDSEEGSEPGETEAESETALETQAEDQTEAPIETQAPETNPVVTQTAAEPLAGAGRSSGGSAFWRVVKAIFWIALILLCLILLLFVFLVIRRRQYEKQREARRKAKQQHRDNQR